jgi:hypothetical protein
MDIIWRSIPISIQVNCDANVLIIKGQHKKKPGNQGVDCRASLKEVLITPMQFVAEGDAANMPVIMLLYA